MAISFADIDQQVSALKKARAVLTLVIDMLPNTAENEDCTWAIALAHGTIHDTIEALEKTVLADLQRDKESS